MNAAPASATPLPMPRGLPGTAGSDALGTAADAAVSPFAGLLQAGVEDQGDAAPVAAKVPDPAASEADAENEDQPTALPDAPDDSLFASLPGFGAWAILGAPVQFAPAPTTGDSPLGESADAIAMTGDASPATATGDMIAEAATAGPRAAAPFLSGQAESPASALSMATTPEPGGAAHAATRFTRSLSVAAETGAAGSVENPALAGSATPTALPSSSATVATSVSALAAPTLPGPPLAMGEDFDTGIGTRVEWMLRENVTHARLRLNPEGLGPIDIQLQVDGSRVNAEFNVANTQVRHALQASVEHLRELLQQQGLQLGQAGVGGQAGHGKPTSQGAAATAADDGLPADGVSDGPTTSTRIALGGSRLLDTWA